MSLVTRMFEEHMSLAVALIVYSYFIATGEQSNYCPELLEKIWETFQMSKAEGNNFQDFSTTEGQAFWY